MFFSVMAKNSQILAINLVTFKRWDGIKDEKFWCCGGSLKNLILKVGVTKNQYIAGELPKKEGSESLQI